MVSCLASFHCKISSEVSATTVMMRSITSTVSIVCDWGLLAHAFFHAEGFFGETFIFLDFSTSVRGSLGGVTLPCSCLSSLFFSSWFTSSPPPPPGESGTISSDALFISCTSSFFFFLELLGPSYSSRVTTGFSMRSGSESSVYLTSTRNFAGHSLVISSIYSSVSL
jgi:hypothetical protein